MEITGKLIQKLPLQSGISKTGNSWQKQEFVIETVEQYPKKICANLWGDKCAMLESIQINDTVAMSFDVESREFNGRWYTDVKAFRLSTMTNVAAAPVATPITNQVPTVPVEHATPQPQAAAMADDMGDDDLPF